MAVLVTFHCVVVGGVGGVVVVVVVVVVVAVVGRVCLVVTEESLQFQSLVRNFGTLDHDSTFEVD